MIGSNLQKFRDVLGESSDSSSGEVSTGTGPGRARWLIGDRLRDAAAEHGVLGEARGMMSSLILPVRRRGYFPLIQR